MLTRLSLLALSLSACTTTIIQEVEVDHEQGGSSWPNTPDAGESTTGEDIEGTSSTGEGSTSDADAGSTTGEAGSSSSSGSTRHLP